MSAPSPEIFIATPTTNGIMLSDYVGSLVRMIAHLNARGIGTEYRSIDGPNLVMQRDMLAQAFLESSATHLLFIDSDMAFEPGLAEKLLSFGKRVIGTIYTRRSLDLKRLKELIPAHGFDHALALAHDWNVRFLGPRLEVRGGLCKVEGIGFGFTLIERACLEELARADCPSYESPLTGGRLRAFFREMSDGADRRLDLDYSFCKHWTQRGGEVWAYAGAEIRHVGDFRYGMPFTAYLAALQAGRPEADAGSGAQSASGAPGQPVAAQRNGARP